MGNRTIGLFFTAAALGVAAFLANTDRPKPDDAPEIAPAAAGTGDEALSSQFRISLRPVAMGPQHIEWIEMVVLPQGDGYQLVHCVQKEAPPPLLKEIGEGIFVMGPKLLMETTRTVVSDKFTDPKEGAIMAREMYKDLMRAGGVLIPPRKPQFI